MFYYNLTGINNQHVIEAMKTVDRVDFVPPELQKDAYFDGPLPIGHKQTISQPSLVALMTELLKPDKDHKVLEIGTGSGYQAAILGRIVKEVYTTEIIPALAEQAKERLEKLGYTNVYVKNADGYFGFKEQAPFDSAIITAAVSEIPEPLLEQIKPGGRIVYPKGKSDGVQQLNICTRKDNGDVVEITVTEVRFVPMTGEALKK